MYESMSQNNKTEVCLWCDGYCNDNNLQVKRKRVEKENEVDDVASELKNCIVVIMVTVTHSIDLGKSNY